MDLLEECCHQGKHGSSGDHGAFFLFFSTYMFGVKRRHGGGNGISPSSHSLLPNGTISSAAVPFCSGVFHFVPSSKAVFAPG